MIIVKSMYNFFYIYKLYNCNLVINYCMHLKFYTFLHYPKEKTV